MSVASCDWSRREVLGAIVGGATLLGAKEAVPVDVLPTPQQLAWQEAELSMFLHFGVNTFTDREWGDGTEDPRIFNPTALDAAQWVHTAKEAGFRYLILTAKHHDGFCLWPSKLTDHSVKSSPWRAGKGDVVAEFVRACHAARLKVGLYLSPWDRHEPTYGDSPAYNRHYMGQLEELMMQYGEIAEVWFDGACGEGPNGKRQEYDWQGFYGVIRKHQPRALIAISGPDIRWVGNEDGFARETEWSVQDSNPGVHSHAGKVWWPAECDVSIRPGWFWHQKQDAQVKSLDHLMDIYYKSVGRNSVLLLNVPPNNLGLLADPDVARLGEFRAERDRIFAHDLAAGRPMIRDAAQGAVEVELARPEAISLVVLQERIEKGQHVEEYRVDARAGGSWVVVSRGTTIGHKKIDRFAPISVDRIRLRVTKSRGRVTIRRMSAFGPSGASVP